MTIYKQFTFDAAHFLPNVPEVYRCREVHGHTYHLTIYVSGPRPYARRLGDGFLRSQSGR